MVLVHRFFSTDTAALRAAEIDAEVILMAKNGVEGIYNKDPKKFKDAVMFNELTHRFVLEHGLEIMDSTAASLCKDNSIDLIVFNMNQEGNIKKAILGEKNWHNCQVGDNMNEQADMVLLEIEERMEKSVYAMRHDFSTIRTGRANPSLLDIITIEYYGVQSPIKQIAAISVPGRAISFILSRLTASVINKLRLQFTHQI